MKWSRVKIDSFEGFEYRLFNKAGTLLASIVQLDKSMAYPGRWWGIAEVKVENPPTNETKYHRTLAEAKSAIEKLVEGS